MLLWIIAILLLLAVFCFVVDLVAQPKWRAVSAGLALGFGALMVAAIDVALK